MAGAIGVAEVLLTARLIKITCPWCRHVQRVGRTPIPNRVCSRCGRRVARPLPLPPR
ncbi:MAG TPA: hypothetical protein VFT22_18400 [Kofleriaceae bacterium]|nr:hypothetical protein [Kofleriaceae bacterium]